jgi:hypothetical protein
MSFVNFTNTAGLGVAVESTRVAAITPNPGLPTSSRILLGAGGESGDASAPYVDVLGTVAATVAALGAGGTSMGIVGMGVITPLGALIGGFGLAGAGASAIRNAAGDFTLTLNALPPAGTLVGVSNGNGGAEIVTTNGPLGLTQNFLSFDAAGAPADSTLVFFLVAPI